MSEERGWVGSAVGLKVLLVGVGDEVAPGRGLSAVGVGGMFGSFWVSGMVIGWVWAVCRH